MTNLQLILLVGALLGWAMTAVDRHFTPVVAVRNSVAGAVGGFTGALMAQGGTVYAPLNWAIWGGTVAGALICAGLAGFMRLPRTP